MAVGVSEKKVRSMEIVQAARDVFIKYGYKKTTVEDIAERLGMVKSSLYYYYRNKQELFGAVVEYEFDRFIQALEQEIGAAAVTAERLTIFSGLAHRFQLEFNNLYHLTVDDIYQNYGRLMDIKSRFIEKIIDVLAEIFRSDKSLRPGNDHRTLARVFIFAIGGIIRGPGVEVSGTAGDELRAFVTLFCRGLSR